MSGIETLVYFDIEATGLKSSGKPRITEMSFVAVNSQSIIDLHERITDYDGKMWKKDRTILESFTPRVMNKLTLCVYPMATIMPNVTSITGLDNYNLTGQGRFDKNTGDLIKAFLDRLPSPVCLLAHNGNLYDFPLLKAEMEKVGVKLGLDILCADSYVGMKEIIKKKEEKIRKEKAMNKKKFWLEKRKLVKTELRTKGINDSKSTTKPGLNIVKKPSISELLMQRKSFRLIPTSFSLINLHKYFLGRAPVQSHGAEADCLTLIRTTAALGMEWIDWVKRNNSLFKDFDQMWGSSWQEQ